MQIQLPENSRILAVLLNLVGLAIGALAVGAFYSFVYQPLDQKQEEHITRIHQLDRLLVQAAGNGREYRELRSELDTLTQVIGEVHKQLEVERTAEELLEQFQQLASTHGLEVLDQQIGGTSQLSELIQTECHLQCRGSYASICRFLAEAEQFAKTVKLHKLEIDTRANLESYSVSMGFVFYSASDSHDIDEKRGVL